MARSAMASAKADASNEYERGRPVSDGDGASG